MIEFDMLSGEFVDETIEEAAASRTWTPAAELYAELRLITVEEAEAQRR